MPPESDLAALVPPAPLILRSSRRLRLEGGLQGAPETPSHMQIPVLQPRLGGELRDLAGDAVASLDGLVDRRTAETATPAQRYALTMLSLWRAGLESRARELVRH